MSIEFACPQCQQPQKVDESKVGQQVYCPVCYFKLTVPAESTNKPIDESQLYSLNAKPWNPKDRQELISFPCEICNTNIGVRKEQVGEEIVCDECGKKIVVPKSIAEKAKARLEDKLEKTLAQRSVKETYSLHDGISEPANDAPKQFRFSCQLCGTALFATQMQIGTDVSCHDCGTKTKVPAQQATHEAAPSPSSMFEGSTVYNLSPPNLSSPSKVRTEEQPSDETNANLVPVVCHFCGTRMQAAESQIGESKTCPDCGRSTEIKAVHKRQKIKTATTSADAYGLNQDEKITPRPVATFRPSLSTALQRKRQNDLESCRSLNRTPLPKRPLTERFFVPFACYETWLHVLFVLAFPLGMMVILLAGIVSPENVPSTFGLAIFTVCVGALCFFVCVAALSYFATFLLHLYSLTSSGMDNGEFKGEMAPMDYFVNGFWLFAFSWVATVPGFLFGKLFVSEALLIVVLLRISHWLFFPICFLSSMEAGSMLSVLAKNTIASLFRQRFVWCRFYLLTGALFVIADLCFVGALWLASTGSMFLVTFALFFVLFAIQSLFYFRLLGRLAWSLEEADRQERELEEEE